MSELIPLFPMGRRGGGCYTHHAEHFSPFSVITSRFQTRHSKTKIYGNGENSQRVSVETAS